MRRKRSFLETVLLSIAACALGFSSAACGGGAQPKPGPPPGAPASVQVVPGSGRTFRFAFWEVPPGFAAGHEVAVSHVICTESVDLEGRRTATTCKPGPAVLPAKAQGPAHALSRLAACATLHEVTPSAQLLRALERDAIGDEPFEPMPRQAVVHTRVVRTKESVAIHRPVEPKGPACDPATCRPPSCNCLDRGMVPFRDRGPVVGSAVGTREEVDPDSLLAHPSDLIFGHKGTIDLSETFPSRSDGGTVGPVDERFRVAPRVGMDDETFYAELSTRMSKLGPTFEGPVEELAYLSNVVLLAMHRRDLDAVRRAGERLAILKGEVARHPPGSSRRSELLLSWFDRILASIAKVTAPGTALRDPCRSAE